jgi:hypothetical protein
MAHSRHFRIIYIVMSVIAVVLPTPVPTITPSDTLLCFDDCQLNCTTFRNSLCASTCGNQTLAWIDQFVCSSDLCQTLTLSPVSSPASINSLSEDRLVINQPNNAVPSIAPVPAAYSMISGRRKLLSLWNTDPCLSSCNGNCDNFW